MNPGADNLASLRERQSAKAIPFRLLSDLGADPLPKRWIFKNLIARGETSAWIAPPGGMKSALMAQLAICAANGRPWFGRPNKERVGVAYFALERDELVARRLQAHCAQLSLPPPPIAIVSQAINLMTNQMVPHVIATLDEAKLRMGIPVGLTIFDTFAKLIVAGGGDEDKARD